MNYGSLQPLFKGLTPNVEIAPPLLSKRDVGLDLHVMALMEGLGSGLDQHGCGLENRDPS